MAIKVWMLWYKRYGAIKAAQLIVLNRSIWASRIECLKEWACGKVGHGERSWTYDMGELHEYICERCGKVLMC